MTVYRSYRDAAESRELLGVLPGADAKFLQQKTKWQTEWNSNLPYCSAEPRPLGQNPLALFGKFLFEYI